MMLQPTEIKLEIPRKIVRLRDELTKWLPDIEAKEFPIKFFNTINPLTDFSMVLPRFFMWLLIDPIDGVINFVGEDQESAKMIKTGADLYTQMTEGTIAPIEIWDDFASRACRRAVQKGVEKIECPVSFALYVAASAADNVNNSSYGESYVRDAFCAASQAENIDREIYASKMAAKLLEILKETK